MRPVRRPAAGPESFILPGGAAGAAQLHVARTVVRRAERAGWAAAERYGTEPADAERPGGVNPLAITYLNRLSDLLFILTRVVNGPEGDVLWIPEASTASDHLETEPMSARSHRQAPSRAGPAGDLVHRPVGGPAVQGGVPAGLGVGLRRAGDRLLG